VPKATPKPVQERLNALINEALTSPEIAKRLAEEFALTSRPLTLEQCAQQDREERAKWAEYVKIARIEPQ
jgi:tripartite-type tricarboxylate transporter receptor subunit TctC